MAPSAPFDLCPWVLNAFSHGPEHTIREVVFFTCYGFLKTID